MVSQSSSDRFYSKIKEARQYSLIRVVVDQPGKALEVLNQGDYWVKTSKVLVTTLDNRPGKLANISERFGDANVNINYVYGSGASDAQTAIYVFNVPDVDKALKSLSD